MSSFDVRCYRLAPCPFCNNKTGTGLDLVDIPNFAEYQVVCLSCWASGPQKDTPAEAVNAWNRQNIPETPTKPGHSQSVLFIDFWRYTLMIVRRWHPLPLDWGVTRWRKHKR